MKLQDSIIKRKTSNVGFIGAVDEKKFVKSGTKTMQSLAESEEGDAEEEDRVAEFGPQFVRYERVDD